MGDIPVVDLFAGAGGLGLGAIQAGGDLRLSLELDPLACETLKANLNGHKSIVLEQDIYKVDGRLIRNLVGLRKSDPLLVIGGPPCQPFSKNSYWTDPGDESRFRKARARGELAIKPTSTPTAKPDKRRSLILEFLRIVDEVKADGFLFENVPSILHPRNKKEFDNLVSEANKIGYKTALKKALALEYGVPQKRERVFLLGLRKDTPTFVKETHHKKVGQNSGRKQLITSGEVLLQLNSEEYFEPEEVVKGKWAEHLRTVPPGMNYKAHTAWAGHPNPTFIAETRFWNFLLKLHPGLPSWTIAATPGPWTGPFHWDSRRLRTIELSTLQSFPKSYIFCGNRRERIKQIGNAVPPLLARKMIEGLIKKVSGGL